MKRLLIAAFLTAVLNSVLFFSQRVLSSSQEKDGSRPLSGERGESSSWKSVAPGMELRFLAPSKSRNGASKDGAGQKGWAEGARIAILRMDPALWELEVVGSSSTGEAAGHTAREWCQRHKFTAAINAGMFGTDQKTHLGYLRSGEHVNNSKQNDYQSVAAFGPKDPANNTRFRIFDLDDPGLTLRRIQEQYASVVQNLRMVKRPGRNQWGQQERKWSEAALGEDRGGRILFIFSRPAYSMHDLIEELLASNIGLVAAQHLEGGPEAQLVLNAGDTKLEMFGSYETSFREDDTNDAAWPIPNVLGVRPRTGKRP